MYLLRDALAIKDGDTNSPVFVVGIDRNLAAARAYKPPATFADVHVEVPQVLFQSLAQPQSARRLRRQHDMASAP